MVPLREIRTLWDTFPGLVPLLKQHGLEQGITVRNKYKPLSDELDEQYEDEWKIKPLLMAKILERTEKDFTDLVKAVEKVAKNLG